MNECVTIAIVSLLIGALIGMFVTGAIRMARDSEVIAERE